MAGTVPRTGARREAQDTKGQNKIPEQVLERGPALRLLHRRELGSQPFSLLHLPPFPNRWGVHYPDPTNSPK
jgi:hypothetical protein